jgi:hypothetical protein
MARALRVNNGELRRFFDIAQNCLLFPALEGKTTTQFDSKQTVIIS